MCEKDGKGNVVVFAFIVTYDNAEYTMFYDCDYARGMNRAFNLKADYECLSDDFSAKVDCVSRENWPEDFWNEHRYDEESGFVCDLKEEVCNA